VPLSSARQNKESEKGLFNTNYEKLQGWQVLDVTSPVVWQTFSVSFLP
jgi:hypothetical protein